MFAFEETPGRTALVDGKEFLFFSGYSYLGMNHVPGFLQLVKDGIDRYGVLYPSSRISNTQLKLYEEFEARLSTITRQEKTVSFSSGYLAGRAVIDALVTDKTACYSLPNTHPTLQVGINSFQVSAEELMVAVNASASVEIIILADAVNPLEASVTDFSFLKQLDNQKEVTCIIDDSHGIGLIGNQGSGTQHLLPALPNVSYVLSYSLSKAFNINGGAASCNAKTANLLRQSTYYTGSTAIAPSLAYAFINAEEIYVAQQTKLKSNIKAFIHLVEDIPGIKYNSQLPIFRLKEDWDCNLFEEHHVIISSFAYPISTGKKINRIVLNALHTIEDLERISQVLHSLK